MYLADPPWDQHKQAKIKDQEVVRVKDQEVMGVKVEGHSTTVKEETHKQDGGNHKEKTNRLGNNYHKYKRKDRLGHNGCKEKAGLDHGKQ